MTEEEKKLLNTFETRLRHLLYLYDELKRENVELKKLLDFEKLKNEKIQAQYDELEVNYGAIHVGVYAFVGKTSIFNWVTFSLVAAESR